MNAKSSEERVGVKKAELNGNVDSENNHGGSSRDIMYYIGLDVHKKTISACCATLLCSVVAGRVRTAQGFYRFFCLRSN